MRTVTGNLTDRTQPLPQTMKMRRSAVTLAAALCLVALACLGARAEEAPQEPPSAVMEAIEAAPSRQGPDASRRRRLHQRHPGRRLQGQQLHCRFLCLVSLASAGARSLKDDGVHEPLRVGRQCARASSTTSRWRCRTAASIPSFVIRATSPPSSIWKIIPSTRSSCIVVMEDTVSGDQRAGVRAGWRTAGDARPGDHAAGLHRRRAQP